MPKAPPAQPKATADPVAGAMAGLNHKYGQGSVMEFGSAERQPVDVISTGSLGLDAALGIGGIPRGRVSEIYGPESSGKTTIALHVIANAQKLGLRALMIDAEHALDPAYAAALGVDIGSLLFSQPNSGEEGLEVCDQLVCAAIEARRQKSPVAPLGVVVIDSVAALVPRAEIDGDMGAAHVGLHARLMSQALRKLTAHVAEANIACVFINQLREKVGVFFGSPETTTGGRALKFYASVRLDARGIETLKDGQLPVGRRTRVKAVKNKMSPPFRQAEFDILFGQGISREGELLDLGLACGAVRKAGAYYSASSDGAVWAALGQGRNAARATLAGEPELAAQVEAAIRRNGLSGLLVPGREPVAAPPERGTTVEPDWGPQLPG